MASFADYTKKKKKQSAVGLSFHEYTEQVLGRDDFDAPTYNTYNVTDEEDIAPVKGGNKNSVFKSGGFSDGVDGVGDFFGDLGETILGTAGDLGLNVIKGAGRLVEGVTDLATYGVAGVADLVGADEFAKKTKKFAQRNTVDDLTQDAEDYLDQYSILGDKADMVSEGLGQVASIILTGGIAGAAGLGTAGATAITTGLTGLSGMGSGMSEAYGSGATDGEAVTYGLISGIAEAATEMLFGGLGKASKAIGVGKSAIPLDDILAKKVASRFTDQIAKNMVEFGIKAGAEGTEEVLSGILQAVGKKATYMTEKEIGEILADENLLEQFVIGTVTSGIAQSGYIPGMQNGSLRESIKTGKDFITGNTQNEQSVIDKEVQNRIAEQEKNGKKLTAKEIGDIEEQVQSDMEKGYFSTDTIEEVLGGEDYKAYKEIADLTDGMTKEYTELGNKERFTLADQYKYQTLSERLNANNAKKDAARAKLDETMQGLVKDTKLAESYNEKARRGQAFEADLSQYEEKYQGTIKKAAESGILNNTRRTHEMVDFIAKVSADKGVLFDFTDNEKLKNSSFAVDGKTVNGYVDENGNVVLNINSAKSLNSTAGHEITHILEGTELYQPLADFISEYARTKGEYDSRLEALNKLYEGVYKGEDFAEKVQKELVADLVGDYIFTDKAFVQKLSTENRNIFQKIYDEIKYLCKVATAGSKEARELEKVKKIFADVYRESGNINKSAQNGTNTDKTYSLSSDNEGTSLSKEQQDFFKDSKMRDENGNLLVVYHGSPKGNTTIFDKSKTSEYNDMGQGIYFSTDLNDASEYMDESKHSKVYNAYVNVTKPFIVSDDVKMPFNEAIELLKLCDDKIIVSDVFQYLKKEAKDGYISTSQFANSNISTYMTEMLEKSKRYDGIIDETVSVKFGLKEGTKHIIVLDSNQIKETANKTPTTNPDIRFSLTEYTEEEKKAHNKAAVDYFGKTYSWNETGYLLLDGTKLDLSGKHEGAPGGYRTVDHRDISDALEEDYGGGDYSGGLVQFMAEGNIRIIPEINGFNLSVKPTTEQARALAEFISRARGEVVLDIDDTNGFTVTSAEYPYGTHASKVLNDIQEWFDNGTELPQYSLSEKGKSLTKYGNFNIYGEDVKLETEPTENVDDIAPVMDSPITEEEAIAQASENLASLGDADAPLEVEEPYTEYTDTTRLDEDTAKNISRSLTDVLSLNKKEAKVIQDVVQQYSTSEMPDKAELFWEIKERFGEKYYTETIDDVAEVRDFLRNYRIRVSDSIKADISEYNKFRRSLFNKVKIVNDGTEVDTAYQELSEIFPSFFPADIINPADQLERIAEVANMDKTQTLSYPLDDETIQEAVDIITDEVSSYKETTARIEAEDIAKESLEDIAPLRAEQIISRKPEAPEPIDTTEYRQAKKLQSLETELADNQQLRSEAVSDYQNRIDRLTDEYVALKDKNSRKANDIVRKIARLERLKANVDADYSKRISGLETRVAEMKQNVKTDRVAEVLVDEPAVEKKKSGGWQSFVTNFVDKGAIFEKLALKNKNRKLQAKYNFLHYSEGIAQRLIGKGTKGVKALVDIKAEVDNTGKTEDFYNYLYHKHNVDRMNLEDRYDDVENKPVFGDYVTSEISQKTAEKYEAENPEFKAYAEDVYTYMNYLRNQLVEKGVISQETADLWAEMYPHYVPIRRVGDSGLNINVALDTNKTGVNAPIKKATGGNSDILPLFDTMAMRTMQTFKAAAKNSFGVELKNTLGTTIETAKTDIDGIIDSVDSHESLLQEGKDGKAPTFTVFENGERVTFEITEDMYDALKPTSKGLAYTNKVARGISSLHRNLLTQYNPTFMLTNAAKDAQDILLNSQHPAKTYANIPQAMAEMISGKGKYYAEYIENGGEQNTYFENDINTFAKEKSTLRKIVGFPLDMISKANDFIERIPRLAEYIASRKSGASVEVAMLDAARVTTNFAAGGDVTKFLNRNGATFLNASVQGAMQQVRNIREAKHNGLKGWLGLATKTIAAGLPALLLNSLLWDDDEEYEELSDYVKDNYYVVGKTEDGTFIRIPKGRAVAVIQDAFEQIGNAMTGDDEVDFANFFELVMNNIAPNNPIENNIIAPLMQVANNETWYGEDLVPTRLQDAPEAEQYDESTDAFSKWLGEKINYSPYKINYLLNQYSGGIGDVFLPMGTPEAESGDNSLVGNLIAPLKDKFTTDSVMNNQNVSDFYDKVDELAKNANSIKATDEDILKNKYMNSVNADLGELYKQKREIHNSSLSDAVKYERVKSIQEQINSLARESLNSYENVSIQGKYATVGDLYYRWYEPSEESDAEAGWQKITGKQLEKQNKVTNTLDISASEYWSNKEEYDYAFDYPENYAVSKVVGGYGAYKTYTSDLYDIKADKDSNGKSISGSRKEKVADYINNLDIDYYEKIILFKSEYNADDTYNMEIIDYLNGREDISYEDMKAILTELGFTVHDNGRITW